MFCIKQSTLFRASSLDNPPTVCVPLTLSPASEKPFLVFHFQPWIGVPFEGVPPSIYLLHRKLLESCILLPLLWDVHHVLCKLVDGIWCHIKLQHCI